MSRGGPICPGLAKPSTLDRESSPLNPQPSTLLTPQPSTLNPKAQSRCLAAVALDPETAEELGLVEAREKLVESVLDSPDPDLQGAAAQVPSMIRA